MFYKAKGLCRYRALPFGKMGRGSSSMILEQLQPNKGSCLATAFACVAGIRVDQVFAAIGNDGTEAGSIKRGIRGHHPMEVIAAMRELGFACTIYPIIFEWELGDRSFNQFLKKKLKDGFMCPCVVWVTQGSDYDHAMVMLEDGRCYDPSTGVKAFIPTEKITTYITVEKIDLICSHQITEKDK
jgi:hypothetical protein